VFLYTYEYKLLARKQSSNVNLSRYHRRRFISHRQIDAPALVSHSQRTTGVPYKLIKVGISDWKRVALGCHEGMFSTTSDYRYAVTVAFVSRQTRKIDCNYTLRV